MLARPRATVGDHRNRHGPADGADEINPSSDGRSLRVVWRRWALAGSKPGSLVDPHITSEVAFSINGTTLVREESLTATEPVTIRRWRFAVPTTAARIGQQSNESRKWTKLESQEGVLEVEKPTADWPLTETVVATADTRLGRGPRLGIPLHLVYESRDIRLEARRPVRWRFAMRVTAGSQIGNNPSTGR